MNLADRRKRNRDRARLRRQDPAYRNAERTRDAAARRIARQQPNARAIEQASNTAARQIARQQPDVRAIEQAANSAARQIARRQPAHKMMATRYDPRIEEYVFHQPCGTWTASCKHGCGYKHLTSSSVSYRNKCCAGGRLSHGNSSNWNEAVDDWFTLDPLPQFMRPILSSPNFSNNSSSYNNLVAMIATKVDNYLPTSGWTRRGPGPASVFLNGRLIKMMLPASSTDQTGGLSFFVYDQLSSLATSPLATNVTPELLGSIITGLLDVNKYCRDLRMLGAEARQNANDNNNLISTMPRQGEHFTVCSVVNNVQSGSITMQIQSRHSHQFSSVSMDSPLVETLSFPIIYLCGEPGWTNKDKHKLKLDQYVMARILRPEHDSNGNFMTAIAPNIPQSPIDSRSGDTFSDDADELEIAEFSIPNVLVPSRLIVNRFSRMARVAEFWICDMFSRQIDQRMDTIRNLESRIMMGQSRSQRQVIAISEEEELERDAAGFNDPDDEDKIVSYLPSSVTGSKRHMKSCARNALQLISNLGCPHVFLTITCNPTWPEIQSQLLEGQTAFNRFDITVPVFKARLDMICANIRNGKYFHGSKISYELHVIEYQYRGLPHAHMVIRLEDGIDTDNPDRNVLIDFVNKHFIAEMPRFEGEEHPNVFHVEGTPPFTDAYKEKCRESVRKHNKHNCAVAINGCKTTESDLCKRGYSNTETRPDTYLDATTDRIVYRRRQINDLLIVPYNLQIMMDLDTHTNCEYSGSSYCAMYIFKYAFKGAAKKEPLELSSERETDSRDEINLYLKGRVTCSMSAFWRFSGFHEYPASIPAVCSITVRTKEQLDYFFDNNEVTDLQIYYSRPLQLSHMTYIDFFTNYNTAMMGKLPKFYDTRPDSKDNFTSDKHYFRVDIQLKSEVQSRFVYVPVNTISRIIRLNMCYPTSGENYYKRLILLNQPATSEIDVRTVPGIHGGDPTIYTNYQQAAIARGYVTDIFDVIATFSEMCTQGTSAEVRSYFAVLTLHGYATRAVFDDSEMQRYMYQDYITFQYKTLEEAKQLMLRDLEKKFRKSNSSLANYGFPTPENIPTELEQAVSHWTNPTTMDNQLQLLAHLNLTFPNNEEQQTAFDNIMSSITSFIASNREDHTHHRFHFIGGPGGTGKSALFRKLHAKCRSLGLIISICAATSLAALNFKGATTAHALFGYPVVEEEDVDSQHPTECNITGERQALLREVTVIFWDEFVSCDRLMMEAVIKQFATLWDNPIYYVFVCAGDFAQVSNKYLDNIYFIIKYSLSCLTDFANCQIR